MSSTFTVIYLLLNIQLKTKTMKKITLLLLLFLGFNSYSQDSTTVDITQAERIVDKYVGQVSDAFEQGLEKVTPVAEQGFEVAVKLQIAKGIVFIIGFTLLFILILFTFFYEPLRDWIMEESGGGIYIFVCLAFVPLGVFLYNGLTRLYAPEWFAIKEIIELF